MCLRGVDCWMVIWRNEEGLLFVRSRKIIGEMEIGMEKDGFEIKCMMMFFFMANFWVYVIKKKNSLLKNI